MTNEKSLKPVNGIVMPAVTAEQAVEAFNAYQDLAKKIMTPDDVQMIQNKEFKKKSFWRKCQRFFNLSLELKSEVREEKNGGFVYKFVFRAIAPNGAYMDGTGTCSSNEKGLLKTEHNTRAIAETRAKNRAIADLVAFGEVSAEEINGEEEINRGTMVSEADRVQKTMKEKGTKYIDTTCVNCGKQMTNNQYVWSMEKYGKSLCFSCQKLEKQEKGTTDSDPSWINEADKE